MTDTANTNNTLSNDPDAIERDILRTQDDMSRTVDKLGDQLSVKNIFNALLDKADENGVDAHYLVDGARRNPIALGLIAAGAIWLVSEKDAKIPSFSSSKSKSDGHDDEQGDVNHGAYVSHMSSLEMRDGEDPSAYQRRRDLHRGTFLMCERKPDEDESSFRQRLDDLTDKFREKRSAWSDSLSQASSSLSQAGSSASQSVQHAAGTAQRAVRQTADRAQDLYGSNPLVAGILAAALGAAAGSAVPISRKEQEALGDVGARARDIVSEQKDQLTSKVMEKKDQLLDQADQKLQSALGSEQGAQPQTGSRRDSPQDQQQPTSSGKPFIIPEPTH